MCLANDFTQGTNNPVDNVVFVAVPGSQHGHHIGHLQRGIGLDALADGDVGHFARVGVMRTTLTRRTNATAKALAGGQHTRLLPKPMQLCSQRGGSAKAQKRSRGGKGIKDISPAKLRTQLHSNVVVVDVTGNAHGRNVIHIAMRIAIILDPTRLALRPKSRMHQATGANHARHSGLGTV